MPQGRRGAEASRVAEVAVSTWQVMVSQLTPVIGAHGVDVLFKRALHVTSSDFPWLASAGEGSDSTALLVSLNISFEARDPAATAEASYALLVTFTELLASMIGGSLTDRLLDPVWASPPGQERERHDE